MIRLYIMIALLVCISFYYVIEQPFSLDSKTVTVTLKDNQYNKEDWRFEHCTSSSNECGRLNQ
jgi:hypothetical protein